MSAEGSYKNELWLKKTRKSRNDEEVYLSNIGVKEQQMIISLKLRTLSIERIQYSGKSSLIWHQIRKLEDVITNKLFRIGKHLNEYSHIIYRGFFSTRAVKED